MPVSIGQKPPGTDAASLLEDCHARIRRFAELAQKLAAARDAPPAEVAEAAAGVRRYFAQALPLHVRDEEESIEPRLRGRDAELDAALLTMHAEHLQHGPPLGDLLTLCSELADHPERLAALAPALAGTSAQLGKLFDEHLAREEAVMLPALRQLPSAEQDAIAREMRERRNK